MPSALIRQDLRQADAHQLAQVYFQAAVAEAEQARRRLDAMIALQSHDLQAMARTAAAFVDNLTLVTGNEWVTGKPLAEAMEQTESLYERVPPARALRLRLMSAWSSQDPESFDALFTAAAGDPGAADHVRDLFVYALEWSQAKTVSSVNPQSLVNAVCKALKEHGPSMWAWKRPAA
ncbi:hypothetical protein A6P39_001025 [Streptomyces sp. FXJ1.172]|uniref:hypothetical protein n=1 Tax=Streptomyces sp. FXJ1.172 TaxID=710705 RepID=UPI0007D02013|nr:hypothetical protein [Streptomyces sp. FXJ1.172]WEO92811.1 hypothetical protein A6P39_001025 [Streptomyces sp. FXJ1.172]